MMTHGMGRRGGARVRIEVVRMMMMVMIRGMARIGRNALDDNDGRSKHDVYDDGANETDEEDDEDEYYDGDGEGDEDGYEDGDGDDGCDDGDEDGGEDTYDTEISKMMEVVDDDEEDGNVCDGGNRND
eukprot:576383-Pyramimonas_sp.AAC.1